VRIDQARSASPAAIIATPADPDTGGSRPARSRPSSGDNPAASA
jgi:hypothetical protein